MRRDDRIDDLLALGAVMEGAFLRPVLEDLIDEMAHEVAVIELGPGRLERGARREQRSIELDRFELDRLGARGFQRLRDAELADEARDRGTLRAIDADLDARIIADGDEARLQEALRPI